MVCYIFMVLVRVDALLQKLLIKGDFISLISFLVYVASQKE